MTTPDASLSAGSPVTARWAVACRVAVLFAVAASAALYIQYLNPAEAPFCGLSSGCETVRRSVGYFFSSRYFSIPLVGLVAFGTVFWTSLAWPRTRITLWLTSIGAICAIALVGGQALFVHAFCWLCLVVDVSAILAAAFAAAHDRSLCADREFPDPLRFGTWILLGVLAAALPVIWTHVKPAPDVPSSIRAAYVAGKINVLEFQDFECPYCRKLSPVLKRALESYPNARFVREQYPLSIHPEALPAARADVCAAAQGKGEALADRLVRIDLSEPMIRRAAIGVGVDAVAFDRCLASKVPDSVIDANKKLLDDAGMVGLPTTYIQGKRLLGAVSEAAVRDALDKAARGETNSGIPATVYVPFAFAFLGLVAWLGRTRRVMV